MIKKFGEILLEQNIISKSQLERALDLQKKTGKLIGEILVDMGLIDENMVMEILEFQLGVPHVDLNAYDIDPEVIKFLPESLARKYSAFPVRQKGNTLIVAFNDPLDVFAIHDIRVITGMDIQPAIASKSQIERAIEVFYSAKDSIQEVLREIGVEFYEEPFLETLYDEASAPIIKLVNTVLFRAIYEGASDIHIEPQEKDIRVRYRIDGELFEVIKWPKKLLDSVVTRIKIMAGMDIAQKRIPQDGHFNFPINNTVFDIRVSTMPMIHGEKVVLRIFNHQRMCLDLKLLGFDKWELDLISKMLKFPYGMILVTGPTGSGKTTTLYSMLNSINTPSKNIVTLEDPVEYVLEGVNQLQINPKAGITFASALRSVLRQDPNVIMIGEIRDKETAEIAVRAALTGHLVLSTLHTGDAVGSITRLLDMGIEPSLVASSLIGIISQRLVRKICPYCKEEYKPEAQDLIALSLKSKQKLYRGKGCNFCNKSGFRGRTVISEILLISQKHRELIAKGALTEEFLKISREQGFKSIKENAIKLVEEGITTPREIVKVIFSA
ncbi:MAG: Flp pilus assembly complex ATPase component TadA [Thermosediminibacteraceae bacterium]|nr:Flp pilus assembly complex ATPase component TadA [Thermosediminibacteraceae bacterium]